jgi:hypothetical protein
MENGAILNVGILADSDVIYVPAHHGIHPDAGVFSKHHVA